MNSDLEQMFLKVFKELIPQKILTEWGPKMAAYYAEPQRHYHNEYHILMFQNLYDNFVTVKFPSLTSDDKLRFLLALWFHDIVYDGKSN